MTDHPHIGVFQRAMTAFTAGDMETLAEVFHPEVVWHQGGRGPLSGDYQGREATFEMFAPRADRCGRSGGGEGRTTGPEDR